MSLEMRTGCERCEVALDNEGDAFICRYRCTFCAGCATGMSYLPQLWR